MRIQSVCIEDWGERRDGFVHITQAHRVFIDEFTPVTRQQTRELLKDGHREYMSFLLLDFTSLDVVHSVNLLRATNSRMEEVDVAEAPGPFDLMECITFQLTSNGTRFSLSEMNTAPSKRR